jgi:hypothetical protein
MTTTKIKLLFNQNERAEIACPGNPLNWLMWKYFDLEEYNPAQHYDPASTVLTVPVSCQDPWWQAPHEQGLKLLIDTIREVPEIVDHYWIPVTDPRVLAHKPVPESAFVLTAPDYFMISESERRRQSKHHLYRPERSYRYKALIAMNRVKPHRSLLLEKLGSELDHCLWSYVEQGHFMPDDVVGPPAVWERYINVDWYNYSSFSVIGESMADSHSHARAPFVTEKTWKAVAMQHPFMIVAETQTLEYMHSLGFETFENLWDESYDTTADLSERVAKIVHNVVQYTQEPLDQLTLQKIQHNHERFFDQEWILKIAMDQLIKPIYDYAESR